MADSLRVLFVCAAGMSSSLIKTRVEAEAKAQDFPIDLRAVPVIGIVSDDFAQADVALVAPQVRVQLHELRKWAESNGTPIEAIGFREYGLADASVILDQIRRLAAAPATQ